MFGEGSCATSRKQWNCFLSESARIVLRTDKFFFKKQKAASIMKQPFNFLCADITLYQNGRGS